MNALLAQFLELAKRTDGEAATQSAKKAVDYQAYQVSSSECHYLWVRINITPTMGQVAPSFPLLRNLLTNGRGTWMALSFPHLMTVNIYGRNLEELFEKLLLRKVAWIQEFDGSNWKEPGPDEVCITKIKIDLLGDQPALKSSSKPPEGNRRMAP